MTPIALLVFPDFVIVDNLDLADRSTGFFSLANRELVRYHALIPVNVGWVQGSGGMGMTSAKDRRIGYRSSVDRESWHFGPDDAPASFPAPQRPHIEPGWGSSTGSIPVGRSTRRPCRLAGSG